MGFESVFDLHYVLNALAWNEKEHEHGPSYGWMLNYKFYNILNQEIFYLNAISNNQTNSYEQFVIRNFFSKLEQFIGSKSMSRGILPVFNLSEDENGEKHLYYDLNIYVNTILSGISLTDIPNEVSDYNDNYNEKIEKLKEILREERKKLKDVLVNRKKSVYYEKFMDGYNIDVQQLNGKINEISITVDNLLESKINYCDKMIFACRYFNDFFKKEIKISELMKCFSYDKFCLILCFSMLNQSVDEKNKITTAIKYCTNYFNAYEKYKNDHPNYNPNIIIYNEESGKYEKISADELYKQYKIIMENHSDYYVFSMNDLNLEELNEYILEESGEEELNKKELTSLILMFIEKKRFETISDNEVLESIQKLSEIDDSKISNNEKYQIKQQIDKMEFLLDNKPVKIIKGSGTFSDYYGYIYSNGYVVFDTLNKDFKKSYGNALYAMPYDKMETFADITKKELRSNYKNIIIPIVHRGNWKEKIVSILKLKSNSDVNYDVTDTIDLSKIIDIDQLDELKIIHENLTKNDLEKIEKRKEQIQEMLRIDEELETPSEIDLPREEFNQEEEEAIKSKKSFVELFNLWKNKHKGVKVKRNPIVAAITKERARDEYGNYCCELCGIKEFESSSVDSHHMIPLSLGGIDNIYNTICLCPNCHRDIHSKKVTLNQRYSMFKKILLHIKKDNPEYLPKLEKMLSPIANSEEYYQNHQKEIDGNFEILWNGENSQIK